MARQKDGINKSKRGTLLTKRCGAKKSILIVALHRPNVKNAFNDDVYEDLIDVFEDTERDATLSAIVLTGTGSYFSSGADLKGFNFQPEHGGRQSPDKPVGRFMMKMIAFPKLLVAAVNGPAVGIGTTLLLHCDLVYCAPSANFWTPFTRIALVPEFCSSTLFVDRMGVAKANELLLLGKKIDAQTAVNWNLCSRIVSSTIDQSSGNPFHSQSLANLMVDELDEKLLSLPLADQTVKYFVSMVRGRHRDHLRSVCHDELIKMDERIESGQVLTAVSELMKMKMSKQHQSRL